MVIYSSNADTVKYSGILELVNSSKQSFRKNHKVIVVIHKTLNKHFAVVYPLWGLDSSRRPLFSINLKATNIEKSSSVPENEFFVTPHCDGFSFHFRVAEHKEKQPIDSWIAMMKNDIDKSGSKKSTIKTKSLNFNLSILNESNEDEC